LALTVYALDRLFYAKFGETKACGAQNPSDPSKTSLSLKVGYHNAARFDPHPIRDGGACRADEDSGMHFQI
jgi:hypothetical protein